MRARISAASEMSLSDEVDRGITVTELAPMDQAIGVSRETTAAFVGRTLRGPLNEPVLVGNFGEFKRRFGASWARSSLGPAVQQFFDHGGRRLYIVRVANNAKGALLCLPANGSALVLRAREPGSSEALRAAVDFDRIADGDTDSFNLTLQRLDPVTGFVVDQEIYEAANWRNGSGAFIGDSLASSGIATLEKPWPTRRPEATSGGDRPFADAYVSVTEPGTDGQELSDYDLVGSRRAATGLFALRHVEGVDLLYLPPPGKGRDLGPASIVAADLFCRGRGAMLIIDPPGVWTSPAQALAGVRKLGLGSANAIGYFPRLWSRDDDVPTGRAAGGALAGLLCKLDRTRGPWHSLGWPDTGFARRLRTVVDVDEEAAEQLIRAGLNVLATGPAGRAQLHGSVTLGRGGESHPGFSSLSVRRSCLCILNAIERATRWSVFDADSANLAARIESQIVAYFASLASCGAFANERYGVACETVGAGKGGVRRVLIFVTFQPAGCREPIAFRLCHEASGCRVLAAAFPPPMEHCA
jgi:Bacteriophage tail sheath protein